ncbi:uncharacterized protein LOC110641239 [Hevea brasiliensis]|uniref:uncharacterized protein LOC110641239 n=1 Tax=Hevea brasiliensis TaxID=3981 RepID=UPI0025F5686E|nr:uncharacterized protein LOC110641239 [Hevea brasiliensis]XP_021648583.2 uncharacterized protein LOC110641239 [Hevea brasiliensis]
MGGKRLRCKTTSENPGTEETNDKGQSVDFMSAGSSLKLYIQQQDQSVNPWSCQKEKQQNQEMQIPPSEDAFPANSGGSGTTIVQGYEVKASVAPVLTAIFA